MPFTNWRRWRYETIAEVNIKVNADMSEDARWLLNRQERMERQRLEFIGDLFRYTANLVMTYDKDDANAEQEERE